jgi:hypothetical protein
METTSYKITILGIRLTAKFTHIILPFDDNILNGILQNLGYQLEVQPPKGISGIELVPVGRIARRQQLEVDFNRDKQVLGISGNNYDAVLDAFTELTTTLEQAVDPTKLKVSFYETLISATTKGSKNPLETFDSVSKEFPKIKDFDNILGEKVFQLGIRLSPSGRPIDDTDWFEYRIEPFIFQSEKLYSILYIYRNKEFEQVNRAIYNFQNYSQDMMKILERS